LFFGSNPRIWTFVPSRRKSPSVGCSSSFGSVLWGLRFAKTIIDRFLLAHLQSRSLTRIPVLSRVACVSDLCPPQAQRFEDFASQKRLLIVFC